MKVFTGKVIATKMKDTTTVMIERVVIHPIYKKRITRIKKCHVHDSIGVKVNQKVKFITSRPYSKLKRWKVIEIVDIENKVERKSPKTAKKGRKISKQKPK